MSDTRTTKKAFNHCWQCKIQHFTVKELLNNYYCREYTVHLYKKEVLEENQEIFLNQYSNIWNESLHGLYRSRCSGNSKLRTYGNFKFSQETENYIKLLLSNKH